MRKKKLMRIGLYTGHTLSDSTLFSSQHGSFSDWGQSEAKYPADVETCMSLCLYSTPFTFHPTALLLSIRSELPFSALNSLFSC